MKREIIQLQKLKTSPLDNKVFMIILQQSLMIKEEVAEMIMEEVVVMMEVEEVVVMMEVGEVVVMMEVEEVIKIINLLLLILIGLGIHF